MRQLLLELVRAPQIVAVQDCYQWRRSLLESALTRRVASTPLESTYHSDAAIFPSHIGCSFCSVILTGVVDD